MGGHSRPLRCGSERKEQNASYVLMTLLRCGDGGECCESRGQNTGSILRQLKITRRLSTTCLKSILEYFGHIVRRDGYNLEKIVVTGKVKERDLEDVARFVGRIKSALLLTPKCILL
ncbi:jg18277 [Pararge aegeria aegeria]|uniref:Jg18277 protein n=1 Tax=Pararge aegeria aegeria TaxID=348720 RepID=A0A8S4SJ84_9NEOP|nr:jg18277 [Pararge aegeria aegeria]